MQALLTSTVIVALAEIGDKTQLLSLILAARFRRPVPIIFGILIATLANHAIAAFAGAWAASWFSPSTLQWLLGLSFILMAGWILIPDKLDNESSAPSRYGAFLTTLVIFFLAEIGDKTQIATVVLAARFPDLLMVIAGTTLGMMAANVPVVLAAEAIADRLPVKLIRQITALIFALLGGWILTGIGQ